MAMAEATTRPTCVVKLHHHRRRTWLSMAPELQDVRNGPGSLARERRANAKFLFSSELDRIG